MTVLSRLAALAAAAGIAFVLSACANKPPAPCPEVRVDSATAQFTKFRDGPGRTSGDVEYRVEMAGFQGECHVTAAEVDVSVNLDFTITPGPANKSGDVPIYYFAAIPQFFPQPAGKQIFQMNYSASGPNGGVRRERVSDLHVKIPIGKDQTAASFDIYLGLQLTNDQLQFNRANVPN